MIIGKIPFFLILFFLLAGPFVLTRLLWIEHAGKEMGVMSYEGAGTAGELLTYSHIYFLHAGKSIEFTAPPGLGYKRGDQVPVLYSAADPSDARVNSWIGLWGDLSIYLGIPGMVFLICLLHPSVVPWGSRLRVTLKSPYIRLWFTHPN